MQFDNLKIRVFYNVLGRIQSTAHFISLHIIFDELSGKITLLSKQFFYRTYFS
ncbi:hypothetical protein [Canicola haemoglobinophilus]|uniref:hypothetical protein n=1 Tax=Canicola haemoglobinophilus TaxID=733 RepID=UPI0013017F23|nr:hypothetical protein [Canicola haemoglobinophilus]